MAEDRSLASRASNLALRGLIGAALLLPWRARLWFMSALVRRVIAPLSGYTRRARANLQHVWPERGDHDAIIRATGDNAGRTIIENYSPGLSRRLAGTALTGPGLPALTEARDKDQPVLFLAAHFGNHDAARHVLDASGFPTGGLYRPMANAFFNEHYVRTLERVSGPVFPQTRRGLAGLVSHLRAGGRATLFFDVWDRGGAPIPFLGQPAPTSLSAAELALKYNALLIPYAAIRRDDKVSFDVIIDAPIPTGTPLEMMEEATRRLEQRIADDPGQWFWYHRRWKPERARGAAS